MRALCPPLRVIPFSPTNVLSPKGNNWKSLNKEHTRTTSRYRIGLYSCPNNIFCFTEPTKIQGSWEAYDTLPPKLMDPVSYFSSPNNDSNTVVWKIWTKKLFIYFAQNYLKGGIIKTLNMLNKSYAE